MRMGNGLICRMISRSGQVLLVVTVFFSICFLSINVYADRPAPQTDTFNDAQKLRWAIYTYTVSPGIYQQSCILYDQKNHEVDMREGIVNLATTLFSSTLSIKSLLSPNISDFSLLTTTLGSELDFIGVISGWDVEAEIADIFIAGLATSLGSPTAFAKFCSTKTVSSVIKLYDAWQLWQLAEKINLATALNDLMWNYYAFGGDTTQIKTYYNITDSYCTGTYSDFDCIVKYFSQTQNVDYDKLFDAALGILGYMNRTYTRLMNLSGHIPSVPELYSPAGTIDPGQINLAWSQSDCELCGTVTYNLEVHKDGVAVFKADDDLGHLIDKNSFTLPEPLEPNTTYWWAVFPRNQFGVWNLDVGDWASFTTGSSGVNAQPVAVFTLSNEVGYPSTVFGVNAGQSYDPDGTPLQYRWNWGDGNGFTIWNSSPANSHQYQQSGKYTITLCVTDGVAESYFSKAVIVWQENQPPNKALNQKPYESAIRLSIETDIVWIDGGGATSYEIYFGTTPVLTETDLMLDANVRQFDPGLLAYGTTYYWRIDAKNAYGKNIGDVWSFTTTPPPPWLAYHYWDFDTDDTEGWTARNAISEGVYDQEYWIIDPTVDAASKSGIISAPNLTGLHTIEYDTLEIRAAVQNDFVNPLQAYLLIDGQWMGPFDLDYVSGEQADNSQCVYRGPIPYAGRIQQVRIDFMWGSDSNEDRVFIDRVSFLQLSEPSLLTVSGYVKDETGVGITGTTLNFSNGGGAIITDSTGYYHHEVTDGWSGLVVPYKSCYIFEPVSRACFQLTTSLSMNFTGILPQNISTQTFYVDTENVYDGFLFKKGFDDYVAVQSADIADAVSNPAYTTMLTVGQDKAESGEYYVYRTIIPFDTSALPVNCTITGATLYLYGYGPDYSDTDFDIQVVAGSTTAADGLELLDFGKFGAVSGGFLNSYQWQGNNGINSILLNATGLGLIKKNDITSIGLRSIRDTEQQVPHGHEFVNIWSAKAGVFYQPHLVVEYTTFGGRLDTGAWPMYRHDPQHTGRSPYAGRGGGNLRWRYQTSSKIYSSPSIGSDGTIYNASLYGDLYAFNSDGSLKWQYKLNLHNVWSSPAIGADGTLYIGSPQTWTGTYDPYFYAINPNGTLKWRVGVGDGIGDSPAIGSDGTIYAGSIDGILYAFTTDGNQKWKFYTNDEIFGSSPAIDPNDTIYIGSYDHYLYAVNPDGTLKWRYLTGGKIYSSPALGDDGTIYFGSDDQYVYALNSNGTLKWRYQTGYNVRSSPAIDVDGTIYIGSEDDYLYALNFNGTLKWRYQTGGQIVSSPAVGADGTVFFGSKDDYLYALNPNGTLKWRYQTADDIDCVTPAIGPDGTVYVGSVDGYFYAIGLSQGVNGSVIDQRTGLPVEDAIISINGTEMLTLADGTYAATVDVGQYDITCSKSGYQTITIPDVVIISGQARKIDFELPVSLYGTVFDALTGDTIYNVQVKTDTNISTQTNILGDYTLGSLNPGVYDIMFTHQDYPPLTLENIEIISGMSKKLDAELAAPLSGTVTDLYTGMIISSATVSTNLGQTTQTDNHGHYLFSSLNPGVYDLTLAKTGYQTVTIPMVIIRPDEILTLNVQLTTPGLLNITSTSLPSAETTVEYNARIRITGGTFPYTYTIVSGMLPPGFILNGAYGNISGVPTTAGTHTFTIGATDFFNAYAERQFSIQVNEKLEIISESPFARGTRGTEYFSSIEAGGGTSPYLFSHVSGILPSGISLLSNGNLAGTPVSIGAYDFTIRVTDSVNRFAEKSFHLEIADTLVISTNTLHNGIVGDVFNQNLAASGGSGRYTWDVYSGILPAGLSLDSAGGVLSGTPLEATRGTIVLSVSDDQGRVTYKDLIFQVCDPLQILTGMLPDALMSAQYSEAIRLSGGIPPYTFTHGGLLPTGLTLGTGTGIISGTPTLAGLTNVSITVIDSTYPINQAVTKTLDIRVTSMLTITTPAVLPGARNGEAICPIVMAAGGGPLALQLAGRGRLHARRHYFKPCHRRNVRHPFG